MFRTTAKGELADFGYASSAHGYLHRYSGNSLAGASASQDDRRLKADRLSWLCIDKAASALITHRGIQISHAIIEGNLDLSRANIPFPIVIHKCVFNGTLMLDSSNLLELDLESTEIQGLKANDVNVKGSIILAHAFIAHGPVEMVGAIIDRSLRCGGGIFLNSVGDALNCRGAKVAGSVHLDAGFRAAGRTNLISVNIGGDLECSDGHFSNSGADAINADTINIRGGAYLRDKFEADGTVNFIYATIGAGLILNKAHLSTKKGPALLCSYATISGYLDCAGAEFTSNSRALTARACTITGSVFLSDKFKARGGIDFARAKIGGNLNCQEGYFVPPAEEEDWPRGAFIAEGCEIGGSVQLRYGFKADGMVDLIEAKINGDLDCSGGDFTQTSEAALSVRQGQIGGSVWFRKLKGNFKAKGILDFSQVEIGQAFRWEDSTGYHDEVTIDLEGARAAMLLNGGADGNEGWPGMLNLHGFVYDELMKDAPQSAKDQLKWLHLQPQDKFLAQPYQQLAATLRAMGLEEQATYIMIAKNRDPGAPAFGRG